MIPLRIFGASEDIPYFCNVKMAEYSSYIYSLKKSVS